VTDVRTLGTIALLLILAASAQAQGGTAQLAGRAVLKTPCGSDRVPNLTVTVTILPDGTWTATDAAGTPFSGTWSPVGRRGRTFDLFFDAATEAGLIATLGADVGELCGAPGGVTVTSVTRKRFRVKLNRKLTRAALVLRYTFTGSIGGIAGGARYRIGAKGPFVPAS
jgi:hypothetical protein